MTLSIMSLSNDCRYAGFHYAECRDYLIVLLNVIMLNVIILSVVNLSVAITLLLC